MADNEIVIVAKLVDEASSGLARIGGLVGSFGANVQGGAPRINAAIGNPLVPSTLTKGLDTSTIATHSFARALGDLRLRSAEVRGVLDLLAPEFIRLGTPILGGVQALSSFGEAAVPVVAAVVGLGVAIGVLTAEVGAAKQIAELSLSLEKMHERTGIATGDLQGLILGLHDLGIEQDSADMALRLFQKHVAEGSVVLRGLGITSRDTGEALGQAADVFASMEAGANKTALAIELFGRRGDQMIPFLNRGAAGMDAARERAEKLGVSLDVASIAAGIKMHEAFNNLGDSLHGLFVQIGTAVLPIVLDLVNGLTALVNIAKTPIVLAIKIASVPVDEVNKGVDAIRTLANTRLHGAAVFPFPQPAPAEAATGPRAINVEDLVRQQSLLDEATKRFQEEQLKAAPASDAVKKLAADFASGALKVQDLTDSTFSATEKMRALAIASQKAADSVQDFEHLRDSIRDVGVELSKPDLVNSPAVIGLASKLRSGTADADALTKQFGSVKAALEAVGSATTIETQVIALERVQRAGVDAKDKIDALARSFLQGEITKPAFAAQVTDLGGTAQGAVEARLNTVHGAVQAINEQRLKLDVPESVSSLAGMLSDANVNEEALARSAASARDIFDATAVSVQRIQLKDRIDEARDAMAGLVNNTRVLDLSAKLRDSTVPAEELVKALGDGKDALRDFGDAKSIADIATQLDHIRDSGGEAADQIRNLADQFKRGALSPEQFVVQVQHLGGDPTEAFKKSMTLPLDDLKAQLEEASQAGQESATLIGAAFQATGAAITDIFQGIGGGMNGILQGFTRALHAFVNSILAEVARLAAISIFRGLLGVVSGGVGALFGGVNTSVGVPLPGSPSLPIPAGIGGLAGAPSSPNGPDAARTPPIDAATLARGFAAALTAAPLLVQAATLDVRTPAPIQTITSLAATPPLKVENRSLAVDQTPIPVNHAPLPVDAPAPLAVRAPRLGVDLPGPLPVSAAPVTVAHIDPLAVRTPPPLDVATRTMPVAPGEVVVGALPTVPTLGVDAPLLHVAPPRALAVQDTAPVRVAVPEFQLARVASVPALRAAPIPALAVEPQRALAIADRGPLPVSRPVLPVDSTPLRVTAPPPLGVAAPRLAVNDPGLTVATPHLPRLFIEDPGALRVAAPRSLDISTPNVSVRAAPLTVIPPPPLRLLDQPPLAVARPSGSVPVDLPSLAPLAVDAAPLSVTPPPALRVQVPAPLAVGRPPGSISVDVPPPVPVDFSPPALTLGPVAPLRVAAPGSIAVARPTSAVKVEAPPAAHVSVGVPPIPPVGFANTPHVGVDRPVLVAPRSIPLGAAPTPRLTVSAAPLRIATPPRIAVVAPTSISTERVPPILAPAIPRLSLDAPTSIPLAAVPPLEVGARFAVVPPPPLRVETPQPVPIAPASGPVPVERPPAIALSLAAPEIPSVGFRPPPRVTVEDPTLVGPRSIAVDAIALPRLGVNAPTLAIQTPPRLSVLAPASIPVRPPAPTVFPPHPPISVNAPGSIPLGSPPPLIAQTRLLLVPPPPQPRPPRQAIVAPPPIHVVAPPIPPLDVNVPARLAVAPPPPFEARVVAAFGPPPRVQVLAPPPSFPPRRPAVPPVPVLVSVARPAAIGVNAPDAISLTSHGVLSVPPVAPLRVEPPDPIALPEATFGDTVVPFATPPVVDFATPPALSLPDLGVAELPVLGFGKPPRGSLSFDGPDALGVDAEPLAVERQTPARPRAVPVEAPALARFARPPVASVAPVPPIRVLAPAAIPLVGRVAAAANPAALPARPAVVSVSVSSSPRVVVPRAAATGPVVIQRPIGFPAAPVVQAPSISSTAERVTSLVTLTRSESLSTQNVERVAPQAVAGKLAAVVSLPPAIPSPRRAPAPVIVNAAFVGEAPVLAPNLLVRPAVAVGRIADRTAPRATTSAGAPSAPPRQPSGFRTPDSISPIALSLPEFTPTFHVEQSAALSPQPLAPSEPGREAVPLPVPAPLPSARFPIIPALQAPRSPGALGAGIASRLLAPGGLPPARVFVVPGLAPPQRGLTFPAFPPLRIAAAPIRALDPQRLRIEPVRIVLPQSPSRSTSATAAPSPQRSQQPAPRPRTPGNVFNVNAINAKTFLDAILSSSGELRRAQDRVNTLGDY